MCAVIASRPAQRCQVQLFDSLEQLVPLRHVWNQLWRQTPQAGFFGSWQWLHCFWRHFGRRKQLRVLVWSCGEEVRGILPLVIAREWTKAGPLRFLTYPLQNWGTFYGPLGPQPQQTLEATLAWLLEHVRGWDVLELRWVPLSGKHGRATSAALEQLGLSAVETVMERSPVVRFPRSWDAYLASRSSKWRNSWRRAVKRVQQAGKVTWVRYRPRGENFGEADPRWDLFEQALEVSRRSWQARATDGTTLCHPQVLPFFRDLHREAVRLGAVELALMYLDGRPVTYHYNLIHQRRLFGLRTGYDQQLRQLGIGLVATARLIQDSIQRGDRWLDMGAPPTLFKSQLATDIAPVGRFTWARPGSLRAALYQWKRRRDHRRQVADATRRENETD